MSNPPNKTRTQPGLGEGGADAVPRLTSAEMKRVRRDAREEAPQSAERTPPPVGMAERPRLRDSVRREDPDDPPVASRPAEETRHRRPNDSVQRDDAPASMAPASARPAESVRPRLRDSVRREDPDDATPATPRAEQVSLRPMAPTAPPRKGSGTPPRRGSALWPNVPPEKDAAARSKTASARSQRPPVTVDEVGATALKIARTTRREGAPKLIASRAIIAKAPIDTRSAFVLSLVDGRNTVDSIVDMAGMPADEVKAILERLARLGLIQNP